MANKSWPFVGHCNPNGGMGWAAKFPPFFFDIAVKFGCEILDGTFLTQAQGMMRILRKFSIARLLDSWLLEFVLCLFCFLICVRKNK